MVVFWDIGHEFQVKKRVQKNVNLWSLTITGGGGGGGVGGGSAQTIPLLQNSIVF